MRNYMTKADDEVVDAIVMSKGDSDKLSSLRVRRRFHAEPHATDSISPLRASLRIGQCVIDVHGDKVGCPSGSLKHFLETFLLQRRPVLDSLFNSAIIYKLDACRENRRGSHKCTACSSIGNDIGISLAARSRQSTSSIAVFEHSMRATWHDKIMNS